MNEIKTVSKPKRIFLSFASFIPLTIFQYWSTAAYPQTGTLAVVSWVMLGLCIALLITAFRWYRTSYFDWAITIYFGVAAFSLVIWPSYAVPVFTIYSVTGIYACLFAAAFFPPIFGLDPFTYYYAKQTTKPEIWDNPIFYRINMNMTYIWAALFAFSMLVSLYPSFVTRLVVPMVILLGFGVPFNRRYPDWYLKKAGLPTLAEQKASTAQEPRGMNPPSDPDKLPKSAYEAIGRMTEAFNSREAGSLSAIIGFVVSGDEQFEQYLKIENGQCKQEVHPSRKPDLLIRTPADLWLGIARRERNGQSAFMNKEYTAEGNLGILMRMNRLFSGPAQDPSFETEALNSSAEEPPVSSRIEKATSNSQSTRKENIMKVFAVNSSPRTGDQSKTELMLNRLVQGMRDAGAEVEVVELRKKTVKYCIGCFTCWTKTPGVCIHKDDMTQELYPKFLESDLTVLAFPLYHFTVNAAMKAFIERTLPILEPYLVGSEGDKTRHPLRHDFPKIAVLSVAGFPELPVFDQLSSYVRFIFKERLVAEIYRPGAEAWRDVVEDKPRKDVFEALIQGGREIVQSMHIAPETMARITAPVMDFERMRKIANVFWDSCIAEGVTPKEFAQKGLMPRPNSIETYMIFVPMGFNPKAAGDLKATYQFRFTGKVTGSCYLVVENGTMKAYEGEATKPDLTIETPFDVWMDIMTGKADGQKMFMEQKYRVVGDLSLLMRMASLFGK